MRNVPRPPTESEVSIAAARMAVEVTDDLTKGSLRADHVKHILDALDGATRRGAAAQERASRHAQYAEEWETEARRLRGVNERLCVAATALLGALDECKQCGPHREARVLREVLGETINR